MFEQLEQLTTEKRNPASIKIDTCSVVEILKIISNEDKKVAKAVEMEVPYIEQAVEIVVNSFKRGGRLFYVGAGTSGRLGVLDAVECPPTFGSDHEMVQGLIAGGSKAMFRAQEGAEDRETEGTRDIDRAKVEAKDVVCGIAASLRTPYVIGAVKRAKQRGAFIVYITTNPRTKLNTREFADLAKAIDVTICPDVGPEVIMGSTRMKSGTAQKLVLNMITTTAMIRIGKVYENLMVDLKLTNNKLRERAKRIIMTVTGVSYEKANDYLKKADGRVKIALIMIEAKVSRNEARRRLSKAGGFVRGAIEGKEYHHKEKK